MKKNEPTVLFLDDEKTVLKLADRVLAGEHYHVLTTTQPAEARSILSSGNVKAVICDQHMPEMTGIDFFREIKKDHPDIIRILLTGQADFAVAEEAINVGEVYRFISKPWKTTELKILLRQALERFDLIAENRQLFEDTKKKKQALEMTNLNLRAMYKVQEEFIATVSHELRTPLASIKGAVDILASEQAGELKEQQKEILGKAITGIERLQALVSDVLDISELESGNIQLKIQPQPVKPLVERAVEAYRGPAITKGLSISADIENGLPEALFDPYWLYQVLKNLLDNAIKFTDKGNIVVSCRKIEESDGIEIRVKDEGCGMNAEDVYKAFEKFSQLGDVTRRDKGGTGLGLAICKEVIEQHGGKISVDSELGKGSTFYIQLPLGKMDKEVCSNG